MPIFKKSPPFSEFKSIATSDEISTNYETKEVTNLLTGKTRVVSVVDAQGKPVVSGIALTSEQRTKALINYFIKVGVDYKGQSQCCYEKKGHGAQIDASIDPARLSLGVVSTEIKAAGGVTRSKQVLLILQRGPSEIESFKIASPIMINCLIGSAWESKVCAGIELSIGIKYSTGIGNKMEITDADGYKWGGEGKFESAPDTDPQPKFSLENAGLSFEASAKAGIGAGANYSYEHFYAEDISPIPCIDRAKIEETLGDLFADGSYKALTKIKACEFVNANPFIFGTISYNNRWWGHVTSQTISDKLSAGCAKKIDPITKNKAEALIAALRCWVNKDIPPSLPTLLRISAHKRGGNVGLKASAGISANAMGLGSAKIEVSGKAIDVSGSYKTANTRYQTAYSVSNGGQSGNDYNVMMTQDSKIYYKQFVFTPLSLKAETSVTVLHSRNLSEKPLNRFGLKPEYGIGNNENKFENIVFKERNLLNRMTYITTTVFWHSSPKLFEGRQKTGFFGGAIENKQFWSVGSLLGTGLSFGGSFDLDNLMSFYDSYDGVMEEFLNQSAKEYFMTIASSLSVTVEQLCQFFMKLMDEAGYSYLRNLKRLNKIEAVLLESSFSVNATINLVVTVKGAKELIELAPDTAKKLLEIHPSSRKLEAIRLRYRIQDSANNDSEFSLGIKIAGNGLGITYKNVDQAGSEGIVDLATIWMDSSLGDSVSAYEKGVPPVTLFCQ